MTQARASDPDKKVFVRLPIDVSRTANGALTNTARVCSSQEAITNAETACEVPRVEPGHYEVGAHHSYEGEPGGDKFADAEFNVFDGAAKAGTTPLRTAAVASAATTGNVSIQGLRVSDFANNEAVQAGAPGWSITGSQRPRRRRAMNCSHSRRQRDRRRRAVSANADERTANLFSKVINVKANAGFKLPLTGGGMGTAVLTIGGIAILAIVLLVRVVVATPRRAE